MKRIVDGKLFDTAAANLICSHWNGHDSSDSRHVTEDLYRTKNENFFIKYSGGGSTRYARRIGDSSCDGEGIKVVDDAEARQFLEAHGSADLYETYFDAEEA